MWGADRQNVSRHPIRFFAIFLMRMAQTLSWLDFPQIRAKGSFHEAFRSFRKKNLKKSNRMQKLDF